MQVPLALGGCATCDEIWRLGLGATGSIFSMALETVGDKPNDDNNIVYRCIINRYIYIYMYTNKYICLYRHNLSRIDTSNVQHKNMSAVIVAHANEN